MKRWQVALEFYQIWHWRWWLSGVITLFLVLAFRAG